MKEGNSVEFTLGGFDWRVFYSRVAKNNGFYLYSFVVQNLNTGDITDATQHMLAKNSKQFITRVKYVIKQNN